ncbi:MAG: phosphoribosylformylglycinamidine cyclo-ligase [Bdellovibrionales bacterium]
MDYKSAGVDIEQGEALVEWLKADEKSLQSPYGQVLSGIGGFAALFATNFKAMKSPVLVSATDGIGTKVKLAAQFKKYKGVGQDLVAMCVNDLICVGATPLFFLDYYATGKLEQSAAREFLQGVRDACAQSGCSLIGGETAEMPGVYQVGDFDAAGFCVGVVDKEKIFQPHWVKAGDAVIGIASNGFHSNGYSLLRQLFGEDMQAWQEELLQPTHLYPQLWELLRSDNVEIHGLAHITGGGMDNIVRVLPTGLDVQLEPWNVPEPFLEAKKRGQLSWLQLLKTFNCGVGLAVIAPASNADQIMSLSRQSGFNAFQIGRIRDNGGGPATWKFELSEWEQGGVE